MLATSLVVGAALASLAGADWSPLTAGFRAGDFDVASASYAVTLTSSRGLSITVAPCHDAFLVARPAAVLQPLCRPGWWTHGVEPPPQRRLQDGLRALLGVPRLTYLAGGDHPVVMVVRREGRGLRIEKEVTGFAEALSRYLHGVGYQAAHVVHDDRGMAWTRQDEHAPLSRLGLQPAPDRTPWAELPADRRWVALTDPDTRETVTLRARPNTRFVLNRPGRVLLRVQTFDPPLSSPVRVVEELSIGGDGDLP